MNPALFSRRSFIARSGCVGLGLASAAGLGLPSLRSWAADPPADGSSLIKSVTDPEVRAGVDAAINQNLIPAAVERLYPGHFYISADGGAFGGDATWPGLDSWQMAGAYLLLGRTRLVLDYFEFVRASQRKDGNIPFAIFGGETKPGGCLQGLKSPEDVFAYDPPKREGLPASSQVKQTWIGLFEHWQPKANPLSRLGAVCYILTAGEIFATTKDLGWLRERLPSIEAVAKHIQSQKHANGLISGSGFYTEAPPRYAWDGVTQCYVIHAFRELAKLFAATGNPTSQTLWSANADQLAKTFVATFWRDDHFGEYVHPERGLVDAHGLSDVNWAAVAFGIATEKKLDALWARLMKEPGFWHGDMPTQTVTKPFSYETWEHNEPVPIVFDPVNDVAAMGRAWYVEAVACQKMGARQRLLDAARKVSRAGKTDGHWRERYHPQADGSVKPSGAAKYCEYAAVLTRVVFGNRGVFCS